MYRWSHFGLHQCDVWEYLAELPTLVVRSTNNYSSTPNITISSRLLECNSRGVLGSCANSSSTTKTTFKLTTIGEALHLSFKTLRRGDTCIQNGPVADFLSCAIYLLIYLDRSRSVIIWGRGNRGRLQHFQACPVILLLLIHDGDYNTPSITISESTTFVNN